MGDVWTKRNDGECEAAILKALERRPLSYRELWAEVAGGKPGKRLERVLDGLLKAGKVTEFATRRTFDYGTERMLRRNTRKRFAE